MNAPGPCGCTEPDLMGDGRCRACTPASPAEDERAPVAFSSQAGLATFTGRGRYRIDTAPMRSDDQA